MEHYPFLVSSYEESHAKRKTDKIALIDADRYKHVVTYRVFQELQNGKEHTKLLVTEIIDDYLYRDIFARIECPVYLFCFSAPSGNVFRNWVSQEKKYKGNRENVSDPNSYDQKYDDMVFVYTYIKEHYSTLIFDDLEADDILSMLQHEDRSFIFSHDKDLKQVPGFHFNMDGGYLDYVTKEEGFERLVFQILKGDSTDNIPGLFRFGEKKVEKFQEENKGRSDIELFFLAVREFTQKMGVMEGIDCFVEMWSLVSMRINRGAYLREKYASAFMLMEQYLEIEEPEE